MNAPPARVAWLLRWAVILSREHHDVHHKSPYDTYYCITVGLWNPLLDETQFFERTERLLRHVIPSTDSPLRVEREGGLNEVTDRTLVVPACCGRSSPRKCAACRERSRHCKRRK